MRGKGRLIEKHIVQPLGIEIEIRLTKDDMLFRAVYDHKEFRSKEGADLKKQLDAHVKSVSGLKWTPYIKICLEKSHFCARGAVAIIFSMDRFYIGRNDKVTRELDWHNWTEVNDKYNKEERQARLVTRSSWTNLDPDAEGLHGSEVFYRPYSEKLWEGLEALHQTLTGAKERILQLIATEEGLIKIESRGTLALTSGETIDKTDQVG